MDQEFEVERSGRARVWFDSCGVIPDGRGDYTGILIDAKGRYAQFLHPTRRTAFADWWSEPDSSGLKAELDQAERQVKAARGVRVEWWCAEQDVAVALNRAFDQVPDLEGRIVAVWRPMP